MDQETVKSQLRHFTDSGNVAGIVSLIKSLSEAEITYYKTDLIKAYEQIYTSAYYDLATGRVDDPEGFAIGLLIGTLDELKKLNKDPSYEKSTAECYEQLSENSMDARKKLGYIQQVIDIYTALLAEEDDPSIDAAMAKIHLDKMEVQRDFSENAFLTVISYFKFAATDAENIHLLFYSCLRVLSFPFDKNRYWYDHMFGILENMVKEIGLTTPIIYLSWSDNLSKINADFPYKIPEEYATELNAKGVMLLEHVTDYFTEDLELLNKLGDVFKTAAGKMPVNDTEAKLRYYEIAIHYYTQGHHINPAAWTFPVYATNSLMAMARIYYTLALDEAVTISFERGRQLFAQVYEHETDFTLNLYWGEFLIEYNRLVFDFKDEALLEEATEKFLIAKELGNKGYTHPYLSLAKLRLKANDKSGCMELLQECKTIFSNKYYTFNFSEVLKDEDFKEIWEELKTL